MHLAYASELNCIVEGARSPRGEGGAVLLEVILALVLFVAAAAVLTSGLSSSLDTVERLRLNTHAADLAVTVLSELQMGLKTLAANGAQPFDPPMEGWTWEIVATPVQSDSDEANPFKKIEIIIRHDDPVVVYRLGQLLRIDQSKTANPDKLPGVSSF